MDPDQLAVCEGVPEGNACTLPGIGEGQCRQGVCLIIGCGDGVLDPITEACDDGNTDDNDACTNGCALPSCGDGIQQDEEQCDLGDSNADTGSCTANCLDASCGDGRIQTGVEECDNGGNNADDDACTSECKIYFCGDGKVYAGVEVCDGNSDAGDACSDDCLKFERCGDQEIDPDEDCDDGNLNPADGCDACGATEWLAAALVGGNTDATTTAISYPADLAVDGAGTVYFTDTSQNRIRRIDATTGRLTTVAGNGNNGHSGDGGPATSAHLTDPQGLAVDGLGNLFIADTFNHCVRRVDAASGVITTIAGIPRIAGDSGDGGPATEAMLRQPSGIEVDGLGNLLIADRGNHRIRRIDILSGMIETVAGNGSQGFSGDGASATSAQLRYPKDMALDAAGNLYIADADNQRVRRVDSGTGFISTVAGNGGFGDDGDGGLATAAELAAPASVTIDTQGNVLISGTFSARIQRLDIGTGIITTIVGNGVWGLAGDGGAALEASLATPRGLAVHADGTLFIADTLNHRIRRVDPSGTITTLAGTGSTGDGNADVKGDGGAALSALLSAPDASIFSRGDVEIDDLGLLYIADVGHHRIRLVDLTTGIIETVAGAGTDGFSGDGGAAADAHINHPGGLVLDGLGGLYIADTDNHRVRRLDLTASPVVIDTVAGVGSAGFSGDAAEATSAELNAPRGLAVDGAGNLFIADSLNYRVRRVDVTTGDISTVAGVGTAGYSGDGNPAITAELNEVGGIAADSLGNLFIADTANHRVRRVDATTGTISTVAGDGSAAFGGDNGPATSAQLQSPADVVIDGTGTLYIADRGNHRVRRVDGTTGVISTTVGVANTRNGRAGDGGRASEAEAGDVERLAINSAGHLYIGQTGHGRVRRVDATTGEIATVAGRVRPAEEGPLQRARLTDPRALVLAAPFTLFAAGASGTLQAVRDGTDWLDSVVGRYNHSVVTPDLARFRNEDFNDVSGVAYDPQTSLIYISVAKADRLYVVNPVDIGDPDTWTISSLDDYQFIHDVGHNTGYPDFIDGPVLSARFRGPTGLYLDDSTRTLYVADTGNHVIRAIDLSAGLAAATVSTVAGTPETLGFFGDGDVANGALLQGPQAMTVCPNGDLFIADTSNHRIRRMDSSTGVISTVLGDGIATSSGQGDPAVEFSVDEPAGLTCDSLGNLFVTSSSTVRLLPADDSGLVDGSGPVQTIYGAAPRLDFPASTSFCLTGIAVVDAETLQLTDACQGMLIELWRQPVSSP